MKNIKKQSVYSATRSQSRGFQMFNSHLQACFVFVIISECSYTSDLHSKLLQGIPKYKLVAVPPCGKWWENFLSIPIFCAIKDFLYLCPFKHFSSKQMESVCFNTACTEMHHVFFVPLHFLYAFSSSVLYWEFHIYLKTFTIWAHQELCMMT